MQKRLAGSLFCRIDARGLYWFDFLASLQWPPEQVKPIYRLGRGVCNAFALKTLVQVICITKHLQISGLKHQSCMLLTHLKSGRGQWGELISTPHSISGVARLLGTGGIEGSFTHRSSAGAACLPGTSPGVVHCGLSMWFLGFLEVWWLGSKGACPEGTGARA